MTKDGPVDHHAAMHQGLVWAVPTFFNMAEMCSRRWAQDPLVASQTAIIEHLEGAPPVRYSFAQLQVAADAVSHWLVSWGVQVGDRVAIVLPQCFETAVVQMAVMQMGAVSMPLSQLFGPDALQYRLLDSAAVVAFADGPALATLLALRQGTPALRCVVGAGHNQSKATSGMVQQPDVWLDGLMVTESRAGLKGPARSFKAVRTKAIDPAVLIYTSGTTGPPKGALIPHQALLGNLTGFVASQNWFGFWPAAACASMVDSPYPATRQPLGNGMAGDFLKRSTGAVFWSPADWAWTGGLMDALLPTLYFGRPIVAWRGRFSPDLAFRLLQQHSVTHSFLFPTALKAMMKAYPYAGQQFHLHLQAIMSAGEAVGDAVFDYCRDQLGVTVNEMFGQTEINYIVGNCAMNGHLDKGVGWPAKPGSMGRAYPGHRVAVIDAVGRECAVNELGDVALHRLDVHGQPDPIFFLGYWNNPQATADKYTADWCRTGDLAYRDADGYLWYQGRADDVFKSAGYRIGPCEIENCLVKHPAVANAAVVPKPDAQRGAVVKAYVVLASGHAASEELTASLQAHVREQLAPYEYPKEIEYIAELPMTTTGKVQRRVLRLQEMQRAQLG